MEVERNTEDPCKAPIPEDLQHHLNKMLRAVLLSRPVHLNRFLAEYFETELDRRTLSELQSSDVFIRIDQEISEPQKRGKSPDKSFTKPSAAPPTKQHKGPKARRPSETEETKQMSGDDLDSEYYVDYYLTHEADDTSFDYGHSDAEYHEGHAFGDDDQMAVKRDSKYYMDYFLTHETIKRKPRTVNYAQDAFVPVDYDTDNFMDYFLTHEIDPRISSFDQSDRDYSKAYCVPFQDVSRRDSEYCRDYFLTCEAATGEKALLVSDYSDDNFVDYFLTHETDPRISSFDQSDRDYSKAYCVPFQDASRRDSEYCRDYFLTCEPPVSKETGKVVFALGEEAEEHHEQEEQDDSATASFVFTTLPTEGTIEEPEELREPETKGPEIRIEDVQQSREDVITVEVMTPKSKIQKASEGDETYLGLCGSDESFGSMLAAEKDHSSTGQLMAKQLDSGTTELQASSSDGECA